MSKSPKSVAKNIKRLLEATGWSYKELADKAGLTPNKISDYVNLKATPGLDNLDKIATAFGIATSDLVNTEAPLPIVRKTSPEEALQVLTELVQNRLTAEIPNSQPGGLDPDTLAVSLAGLPDEFKNFLVDIIHLTEAAARSHKRTTLTFVKGVLGGNIEAELDKLREQVAREEALEAAKKSSKSGA